MIILNTRTIWTHGWSKLSKNSVSNRCPALCATFCFHFQIDFKSWLRPHHPFRFIPDTIPLPFSEFSTKYTLCRHKHRKPDLNTQTESLSIFNPSSIIALPCPSVTFWPCWKLTNVALVCEDHATSQKVTQPLLALLYSILPDQCCRWSLRQKIF